MLNFIKDIVSVLVYMFGANWRTTLTGYVMSAFIIVEPIITNGNFDIKRDWKNCVVALLVGVFSKITKDKHVTGGNMPNDSANMIDTPQAQPPVTPPTPPPPVKKTIL